MFTGSRNLWTSVDALRGYPPEDCFRNDQIMFLTFIQLYSKHQLYIVLGAYYKNKIILTCDLFFLFNNVCSIIMLYIMFVLKDDFRHDYLCLSV